MQLPESVKEAAREAARVAWYETPATNECIVPIYKVADAVMRAIEDHPDMNHDTDKASVRHNVFEQEDDGQ